MNCSIDEHCFFQFQHPQLKGDFIRIGTITKFDTIDECRFR